MYPLKSFTDINQLQIHVKNLLSQTKKCIEDQTQTNQKMYFYNFEKATLKLHKFTIEFMSHLAINQKIYNCFQEIRSIFTILNKTAKDRKARSFRTYLNQDVFGLFANNHEPSDPEEKNDQEKEQLDLIQQFMIKRNHEIQSNAFGDVDDVFKNRQRRGLEEFLSHTNNQAKNLQNHLKTASIQRKNIRSSSKVGEMTKKLLMKKQTFDLERINEMDLYNRYDYNASRSSFVEEIEKTDQQVQTIFTNSNIRWNKILTYCMKTPQTKEENGNTQLENLFDKEVYGEYDTQILCATQTQTEPIIQSQGQNESSVIVRKIVAKKSGTKGAKKLTYKQSNMKPSRQKSKQTKTQSVYAKDEQKEQSFILKSFSTSQCPPQKRTLNLELYHQVINEFIQPQSNQKQQISIQQQPVFAVRKSEKKLTKAIQPKQIVFELKSKKQVNKKRGQLEQSFRAHKKNKTTIGHIRSTDRTGNAQIYTYKQIAQDQRKPAIVGNRQKESLYEKTSNKEDYSRKRKHDKNFTWKHSIDSSFTNFKQTLKINETESDHTLNNQEHNISKVRQSDTKQNDSQKLNKLIASSNSKSSNFKHLHATTSPDNILSIQKKVLFNKRNTIDQIIVTNQPQTNTNPMMIQLKSNQDHHFIKQEQCQVSNRNTLEKLPIQDQILHQYNKNKHSKRTQKSSPQSKTQTKRTEYILQPLYDKPLVKKQLNATAVVYKRPVKTTQPQQLSSKITTQKSQKKSHTNLRVKTLGKQDDLKGEDTTRLHRNSLTFHNPLLKNNKVIFKGSTKGHNKHLSQELPDLSGCKQKLSDIKKSFSRDLFKNSALNYDKSAIQASNITKNQLLSFPIKNYHQETKIREEKEAKLTKHQKQNKSESKVFSSSVSQYQKMISLQQPNHQALPQTNLKSQPSEQTSIIQTIRRLLMTNSYRDKLLLYISMIEAMHEKICGKKCEHMNKFMSDMTGGVDVAQESVAKQLLKMYSSKTFGFKDLSNMWG